MILLTSQSHYSDVSSGDLGLVPELPSDVALPSSSTTADNEVTYTSTVQEDLMLDNTEFQGFGLADALNFWVVGLLLGFGLSIIPLLVAYVINRAVGFFKK